MKRIKGTWLLWKTVFQVLFPTIDQLPMEKSPHGPSDLVTLMSERSRENWSIATNTAGMFFGAVALIISLVALIISLS